MERNVKQVIIVDKSKSTNIGKYISQISHASLGAFLKMFTKKHYPDERYKYSVEFDDGSMLDKWLNGIFTKICLETNNEDEMVKIYEDICDYNKSLSENEKIPIVLIEDCGKTCFHGVKTKTCVGIGPYWSDVIDKFTGNLKLFR